MNEVHSSSQTQNSWRTMAAFLHHCPFLKSGPKSALRRTGMALLSVAHRCPIIARQISVNSVASPGNDLGISPTKPKADQRRLSTQTSPQVDVSVSNGCPFVTSRIGMVHASPEVQEDIQKGKVHQNRERRKPRKVCQSDRKYLLIRRFDWSWTEGVEGRDPAGISSGRQHHPPAQGQHG